MNTHTHGLMIHMQVLQTECYKRYWRYRQYRQYSALAVLTECDALCGGRIDNNTFHTVHLTALLDLPLGDGKHEIHRCPLPCQHVAFTAEEERKRREGKEGKGE